jgi:hypothetical protein
MSSLDSIARLFLNKKKHKERKGVREEGRKGKNQSIQGH